jgi:hypothetical protein
MNINIFKKGLGKMNIGSSENLSDKSKIWSRLLMVFVLVNVVVVALSLYLFIRISSGDIFSIKQETVVSVETVDRATLRDIIVFFEQKEEEFDRSKTEGPSGDLVDPAL